MIKVSDTDHMEVIIIYQVTAMWTTPIHKYLKNNILPDDERVAHKVQARVTLEILSCGVSNHDEC